MNNNSIEADTYLFIFRTNLVQTFFINVPTYNKSDQLNNDV